MPLVDYQIEDLVIDRSLINPFGHNQLQPCSYDVMLDKQFKILNYDRSAQDCIDLSKNNSNLWSNVEADSITINPQECILGQTIEYFKIPNDMCARLEGKSSLGRYFLTNHITAGFIDNGFEGKITLELFNNFPYPIKLYAGMLIGQICFFQTKTCNNEYDGKYQKQTKPTESKYYLNK